MNKRQANLSRVAARAGKSQPNYALLTTGPLGANLIARVEQTPSTGPTRGRNRVKPISTGQPGWNRPATLPFSTGVVAHDIRWSK